MKRLIKNRITTFITLIVLLGGFFWPQVSFAEIRNVHVPFYEGTITDNKTAVFWFGKVNSTDNYIDVRTGYNGSELYVNLEIFDKFLWYDPSATPTSLTKGDYAVLYLDTSGTGTTPTGTTYKFVGQLNWWEARTNYQAGYKGNGGNWTFSSNPFTTTSGWRGDEPNNNIEDRGWALSFHIPFASLGLTTPPSDGTVWKMGISVFDADNSALTVVTEKKWPENFSVNNISSSWGNLYFGLPVFSAPQSSNTQSITIKNGEGGVVAKDATVGGGSVCGDGLDYWTEWGEKNYSGITYFNIQNQGDVSDWPCFSKYFITFPLTKIPEGKVITKATITMYQFGHAGEGWTPGPQPEYIQAGVVGEDWNEDTISWNNAPLLSDNFTSLYVDPLSSYPDPGVARTWDVSLPATLAYQNKIPLRLAFYTGATEYQTGKYFRSADELLYARPFLSVTFGDANITPTPTISVDINNDGKINAVDFGKIFFSFGTKFGEANYNTLADLNQDKTINLLDVAILLRNWK